VLEGCPIGQHVRNLHSRIIVADDSPNESTRYL
jgi:hypothetical protein